MWCFNLWLLNSGGSKEFYKVYQTVHQTVRLYCLVGIPPNVVHAPKTAAYKMRPTDILHEEKTLSWNSLGTTKAKYGI